MSPSFAPARLAPSIVSMTPGRYDAPMDADSLLLLVRYQAWANDRLLSTASGLTDEELHRHGTHDRGSAFETIRHLVDVDWSWREYCVGNDVGDTYVWDHGTTLDEYLQLHAFTLEEDARLRDYVASLDRSALDEPLAMSWGDTIRVGSSSPTS